MNPIGKPTAKRVGQVVLGFSVLFAAAVAFQNCSGYQAYDSVGEANLSSCGAACTQTAAGLLLKVTSPSVEIFNSELLADNRVVNIGGYCDDAEFSDSVIQYQLYEGSTPYTATSNSSGVKCSDIGRFQIAVPLPASGAKTWTVALQLRIPMPNAADDKYSPPIYHTVIIK